MSDLETAVPEHLRQERTQPVSTPAGYQPAFSAYCARFPPKAKDLVMAILGAQFEDASQDDGSAIRTLQGFVGRSKSNNKTTTSGPEAEAKTETESAVAPSFSELAAVTDARGYHNVAVLAYWPSTEVYRAWDEQSGFSKWFEGLDPTASSPSSSNGWFREIFFPTSDRFETVFSNDAAPEGAAHMQESVSGPMREHGYWGSMRDRMAAAQTDPLAGEPWKPTTASEPPTNTRSARVRVPGRKNLCVIRSGQDWLDTRPAERDLYTTTIHPVLVRGMDFLRDHGDEVGCISCRLMHIVDDDTLQPEGKDRTFGLAYFDDMASLERWSRSHPTHLEIFGGFLQYTKKLDDDISLRLFHEVVVLGEEQQVLEYVGCHEGTGMLAAR